MVSDSGMSDTPEAPARFATCLVAVDIDLAEKSTIFLVTRA